MKDNWQHLTDDDKLRLIGDKPSLDEHVVHQIAWLRTLAYQLEHGLQLGQQSSPLPVVELLECISDLALSIRTAAQTFGERNPEIFEDPFQRSDPLGNIQMIHSYPRNFVLFSQEIENFSESVAQQSIRLAQILKSSQKTQDEFESEVYEISDLESVEISDRQRAKRRIMLLHRENLELLRQNRKTRRYCSKLEEQLQRKKILIESLHNRLKDLTRKDGKR